MPVSPARALLQIQVALFTVLGLIGWGFAPDAALDEARLVVAVAAAALVGSTLLGIGWGVVRIPVVAGEVGVGALGVTLVVNAATADAVAATYRGVLGAAGVAVVASAVTVLLGCTWPLVRRSDRAASSWHDPADARPERRTQIRRVVVANVVALGALALAAGGAEAVRTSPERAFRRELRFACARPELDLGREAGEERVGEFNRLADALVRLDAGVEDLEPPDGLDDGWDQARDAAASTASASSALRDPAVVGEVDEGAVGVTAEVLGRLEPLRTYADRNDIGRCRRF